MLCCHMAGGAAFTSMRICFSAIRQERFGALLVAFYHHRFAQDTPRCRKTNQWRAVPDQIRPKVPKLAAING